MLYKSVNSSVWAFVYEILPSHFFRMKTMHLFSSSFFILLVVSDISVVVPSNVVGCYFGSWAGYRTGDGRFEPENIDASLCTHVFYSFVGITATGGIRHQDEWNDLPSGKDYIARFNALKTTNPNLKTLVAIGGWNEGSLTFSQVANDATLRATFAKNAATFVLEHNFDGFDLDWEYPASSGGAASDYEAFVLLVKELRSVFDEYGLLLTAAVAAGQSYVSTSYNVQEMSKYLDLINLMSYDYHGSWDSTTGHNAPLYKSSVDLDRTLNVDASIQHWLKNGAVADKLVLGVGTYGRSFTLTSASNVAIGASVSGAGAAGPFTLENGVLGYNEICLNINAGWQVVWDESISAPYAYSGNQWVGYDNPQSAKIKAEYARDLGLAGVFVWSIETDDFRGNCGNGKFPIISALHKAILPSDEGSNGASSSTSTSSSSSSTTTTTTESTPSTSSATSSQSTSTASTTQLCSSVGYVRDPNDCQIYYYCQQVGSSFVPIKLFCYGELVYDEKLDQCNYKNQVPECN